MQIGFRYSKRPTMILVALALSVFMLGSMPVHAGLYPNNLTVEINDSIVPLAGGLKVLVPQSPGTEVYKSGGAVIDTSNSSEGYITAQYSGSNQKVKLQIAKAGGSTYTYDLKRRGEFEVFALTAGDGSYNIMIFENISGNQYAQLLACKIDVKMRNPLLPFLYPSQYVNFDADSKTVTKGNELATNASNDLEIVSKVYNHVITAISYDTDKAKNVKSGYLPVVDDILASKKGICFDYAAVMAAMLRSQQIPTRLEVGYVSGGLYHAWISTYIKDIGWINGVIQFDGVSWKLMDPTFASGGASPEFIGDGKNYKTVYIY